MLAAFVLLISVVSISYLKLKKLNLALIEANTRLEQLSQHDPLTGLYNRQYFEPRVQQALALCQRQQLPLTLAMMDLDHFKAINDNYGHTTGDAALKQVAQILTQELRKTDFIGRLGGEEFAIVLPDTTETEARNISQRLRQQVEQQARLVEGKVLGLTISIGAVYSNRFSAGQFERLLKQADDALYDAKRSGRNTVTFYFLG